MSIPDIINTLGVSLILLAFLLLTLKKVSSESNAYNLLNLFGAGLACYGAWLIGAMPFVVLEVIWCAVAVYGLLRKKA
jgi:ribose/xylose/arabinose/galactoside ABC-type transport system permease subunit